MTSGELVYSPMDQPQGLCDVIGLSFRIWRRNLPLIFRVLIFPTITYFGAATALQAAISYGITASADMTRIFSTIGICIAGLIVYIVGLIWLSVRQLSLLRLFTGFAPDWTKADAFGRKKTGWLVGLSTITFLMSTVVIGIWVCMLVISGVIAAAGPAGAIAGAFGMVFGIIGLIITGSLLILLCLMGFSVLACEDTTFFGVISQSFKWTFKYFGRVICFGFIFYVIFSVVSIPVSLPIVIASLADMTWSQIQTGAATDSSYKVSLGVLLFIQIWEGLCSLLLRPVTMIAFGLFYLDLRQRAEGLDLSRKLVELKTSRSGAEHGIQGP